MTSFVEWLEPRVCLSATYDYTIVAQTGAAVTHGTLSSLSTPSINNSGQIGFIGVAANNGVSESGVYSATATGQVTDLSAALENPSRQFGFSQINEGGTVVARDIINSTFFIRSFQANSSYTVLAKSGDNGPIGAYNSVLLPTIANDGRVGFVGLTNNSQTTSLYLNSGIGEGGDQLLTSFPPGSGGLRPMAADDGMVVVRDGGSSTSPIVLYQAGKAPTTIADTASFSALGASPGISSDGQIVAFYGVLTDSGAMTINAAQPTLTPLKPGAGIFASVGTIGGGRKIVRVSGLVPNPVAGGSTGLVGNLNAFDADSRVGVNQIQQTTGPTQLATTFTPTDSFLVTFMGTDNSANDGLYCNRVDVFGGITNPTGLRANTNTLIAEAGDSVTGFGTIGSISDYAPLNDNGQVAFQITSGANSAIVEAQPVPIAAAPYLCQGSATSPGGGDWATTIYANGPATIQSKGCALTSLTMAINYVGTTIPGFSPYDPETLDAALTDNHGYTAGNSVIWTTATSLANSNLRFYYNVSSSAQTLTKMLMESSLPVIVGVNNNSHFVLVTGKTGDVFTINDPGHPANTTLAAYQNHFQTRGFVYDPANASNLSFVVDGTGAPVDLLITGPAGQLSGIDPVTSNTEALIPQSVVFTDALENTLDGGPGSSVSQFVNIFQPQAGAYQFKVGGTTQNVPFVVQTNSLSSTGTNLGSQIHSGMASAGNVSSFQESFTSFAPAVLHQPSVTNATTPENTQSASGLVITPNAADTAIVSNFQITNITGGSLFLSNGTTQITNGEFISVAQGAAGLRFTPAANSLISGYFTVQESTSATIAGLGGSTTIASIAITLPTVNHAPIGKSGTVTTIENTAYQLKTSDFGFTDPNDNPQNTLLAIKFTLLPTAGALKNNGVLVTVNQFISAADVSSGKLVFTPNANLIGGAMFLSRFQVEDNGGTANGGVNLDSIPKILDINILKLSHAPIGTLKTVTTLENTGYKFALTNFGFTDPRDMPANTFTAVKITTLPAAGALKDNGVAVTAGQLLSVADVAAGKLIFTPVTYASGTAYARFTFQVQDNGSTVNGGVNLDPTPKTMTINVTKVNQAPIGTVKTVTTAKNTAYAFKVTDFGFADPRDIPANTLLTVKITTLPLLGKLTDNNVAVVAGAPISVADITAGKLKFTPVTNGTGTAYASFTFQVQDNGGTANGGIDTDPMPKKLTIAVT